MRYLWALMLCAAPVAAQNADKTVAVQVKDTPKNLHTLLRTNRGLGLGITGAALSPDGKLVAIYGHDTGDPNLPKREMRGVLQIWDVASRQKVRDLVGHQQRMQRVFWSHDGQKLVSQSQDGQILLWDVATGKPLFELASALEMPEIGVRDYPVPSLEARRLLKALGEVPQLLGFARDDRHVYGLARPTEKAAVAGQPGKNLAAIFAWDASSGAASAPVEFEAVSSFGFGSARTLSADGQTVFFTQQLYNAGKSVGSQLEQRALSDGSLQNAITGGPDSFFFAISDDGALALLKNSDKSWQLWDVAQKKPLQVLAALGGDFNYAVFSGDKRRLLLQGRTGDIAIYNLAAQKIERRLNGGHWGEISTLEMTPDEQALISVGDMDSTVQLWDLSAAPERSLPARLLLENNNVRQLFAAPDGGLWLGFDQVDWSTDLRIGQSLEVRHLGADGGEIEKISLPETLLVDQMTFSPDFSLAAGELSVMPQPVSRKGVGIGVWDLKREKQLWKIEGNNFSGALAFAPDNRTLATGRYDGTVELWDSQSGKLLLPLLSAPAAITALTFAPDGRTLAIGSGGTVKIIDVASGKLEAETTEDFTPQTIAFSPDGRYLLSGGDITIKNDPVGFKVVLRDAKTRELLRAWLFDAGGDERRFALRRAGESDGVRYFGGLGFSPDSKLLAFAHYANFNRLDRAQVEIWDIAAGARVGLIPDRAMGQLPTFSSDGKTVFTSDGNWIKSWNLAEVLAQNAKP